MAKRDDILKELHLLVVQGTDILGKAEYESKRSALTIEYEAWYSRALEAIRQISPSRLQDFVSCYKQDKRRAIDPNTYTISDYLGNISVMELGKEVFSSARCYQSKFLQQISIVSAAAKLANSVLADMHTMLQAELLDGDIAAAKALKKARHLRSAGVICGVVIESHLKAVSARHAVTIPKKSSAISEMNDLLRNAGVYDVSLWRLLQRLADIRNLCAHSKDRDPRDDEVEDLISGTDKIIKEVI